MRTKYAVSWMLHVTMAEFSEIARLIERCRIRSTDPGRDDGFDDVQWVNGLSRMGLDPPENAREVEIRVVKNPPKIRYERCENGSQNGKLHLEL